MSLNLAQKILSGYLVILILFWIWIHLNSLTGGPINDFYSFSFGLIPLVGRLWGIWQSFEWGGLGSYVGKSILFISAGSFLWGIGTMIWAYYNFFAGVAVPYPSIADLFYVATIPFWALGVSSLSRATGTRTGLKTAGGKVLAYSVPILVFIVSYYLLVVVAREGALITSFEGILKLALDLIYPLGDVIILTLAIIVYGLSRQYLGGIYKMPTHILLLGFTIMYFADFIFSYTTTRETFYTGSFGDLVFTVALFLITLGTLGINPATANKSAI